MTATHHTISAPGHTRDLEPAPIRGLGRTVAWRPLLLKAFVGLVVAGGAAVVAWSGLTAAGHPARFPLIWALAAFALGALRLEGDGHSVSLSLIPVIAAAYLFGPAGGAITGLAASLGVACRSRPPIVKAAFNAALHVLAGCGCAAVGGLFVQHSAPSLLSLCLFSLYAGLTLHLVNAGLLSIAISLSEGTNPLAVWWERFRWIVPQTLLVAPVATGVAIAYRAIGLYEVAAFALPVLAMQVSWQQYLAQAKRRVEELHVKNGELTDLTLQLREANETVHATYRGTLEALVIALDARDNEVQGHSYRVSVFSQLIAEEMGIVCGTPEWEAITRGALLHDVGKIGVADAVLHKPGALDDAEWVEMRRHADIGFGILKDVDFLKPASELVRAHHERYDGTGYPRRLKGEEIPLGARIFAVADTFDAITTDRPYRRAAPPQAAAAEIRRCSGTQFDPAVVAVFERVWPRLWALRSGATTMAA